MTRFCQVSHCVFAALSAVATATGAPDSPPAAPTPAPRPLSVQVRGWTPQPFSDLLLSDPELASCWSFAPRWWAVAGTPDRLPDAAELGMGLGATLTGVVELGGTTLSVVVATADIKLPGAATYGGTVLLLLPESTPWGLGDVIRTIATVVLGAHSRPAAPDERCGEPLLSLAEALAQAGALALAALPPELRPVHDWLEANDTRAVLENLVESALDGEVPWQTRRAQMGRLGRPGGAPPAIAQAAAFLVEAFGDAEAARRKPFELLLAWREGRRPEWPAVPRALRKALGEPLEAGMPDDERTRHDVEEIAIDALRRAVASGSVESGRRTAMTLDLRLEAAARARGLSTGDPCGFLEGAQFPTPLITGCGGEAEPEGLVYVRPTVEGGAEVLSRTIAGHEAPLLRWPRWILFPVVDRPGGELVFIDPQGVWVTELESGGAPRLLLGGSFRFLARSRESGALATVQWPEGTVMFIHDGQTRVSSVAGQGGIAWIEGDVLLASDRRALSLVSLDGESRPWPKELACARSLTPVSGGVLAALAGPCEESLVRFSLADGSVARLLSVTSAPLGVVAFTDGTIAVGVGGELWVWTGGASARRAGVGFTPGPG